MRSWPRRRACSWAIQRRGPRSLGGVRRGPLLYERLGPLTSQSIYSTTSPPWFPAELPRGYEVATVERPCLWCGRAEWCNWSRDELNCLYVGGEFNEERIGSSQGEYSIAEVGVHDPLLPVPIGPRRRSLAQRHSSFATSIPPFQLRSRGIVALKASPASPPGTGRVQGVSQNAITKLNIFIYRTLWLRCRIQYPMTAGAGPPARLGGERR
jgi:hypothetical protein